MERGEAGLVQRALIRCDEALDFLIPAAALTQYRPYILIRQWVLLPADMDAIRPAGQLPLLGFVSLVLVLVAQLAQLIGEVVARDHSLQP